MDAPLPTLPALEGAPDPSVVCPPCGKCCRYVSVGIESPTSVGRASTILWLLYHHGIGVYEAHDGGWFLVVPTECENLKPTGLCGVYESRPLLCRDYDVVGCEGTSPEPAEKLRFDDAGRFVSWLSKKRPALYERCLSAGVIPPALRR